MENHPVLRMLTEPVAQLRRRALQLEEQIDNAVRSRVEIELEETVAQTGSGALPLEKIPSLAVTLRPLVGSVENLARGMRSGQPPVFGYIRDERLFLDMRTVRDDEIEMIADVTNRVS